MIKYFKHKLENQFGYKSDKLMCNSKAKDSLYMYFKCNQTPGCQIKYSVIYNRNTKKADVYSNQVKHNHS